MSTRSQVRTKVGLTVCPADSIHSYIHDQSIARALRDGAELTAEQESIVAGLDEAIATAPPLEQDITTFRLVEEGLLDALEIGAVYEDLAFTSETILEDYVEILHNAQLGHEIVHVEVPEGEPVAYVGQGTNLSPYPHEGEIILARNKRFLVRKNAHGQLVLEVLPSE